MFLLIFSILITILLIIILIRNKNIIDFSIITFINWIFNLIEKYKIFYHTILDKFDFYSNIILFVLLLLFIFVQLLLIIFDKYYIMGWLFMFIIFWTPIFILKILTTFDIFYKNKIIFLNRDEEGKVNINFPKTLLHSIITCLTNIGVFVPFILINSLLYTFIKILPFDQNYINVLYIISGLFFFIFLILISFLKNFLKKSSVVLSKIFLYIAVSMVLINILIQCFSYIFDIFLSHILTNKDLMDKYNLKSIDKFLILKDLKDETFIDVFKYFMFLFFLILSIILTFISIILFHSKCKLNLCNNDEKFFINKVNSYVTKILNYFMNVASFI